MPDFMTHHVEALYVHDSAGRIVAVNDWRGGRVPRFWLGRTETGAIWRCRDDVPGPVAEQLEAVANLEPPGMAGRPVFEHLYRRFLGCESESAWLGPACVLPDDEPLDNASVVLLAQDEGDRLRRYLPEWEEDVRSQQPCAGVLDDAGNVISVCASVRITDSAHEAGVETAPGFRGRGLAVLATRAWAHGVRSLGAWPLYSTSMSNHASRRVLARLGARCYGSDFHLP